MTPPVPLSTLSGQFDFPPASDEHLSLPSNPTEMSSTSVPPSATNLEVSSLPDRLLHLRNQLRSERDQERARREQADSSSQTVLPSSSSPARERRRRQEIMQTIANIRAGSQRPSWSSRYSPPITFSASQQRPRATPGARFLQHLRSQDDTVHSSLSDLQQAGARLAEASSELRSLLDQQVSISPNITGQDYSGEAEVNRRHKRRRLDPETLRPVVANIRYGHYGEVESGPLKIELVSCDGGNFSDVQGGDRAYWAENVVRNDKSVYCSKSNTCNLVLRHRGETAFCLRKLVIKAPQTGYTAPVQEGMIFVSMTSEDLLLRTQRYTIQYPPLNCYSGHPNNPTDSNEPVEPEIIQRAIARYRHSRHRHEPWIYPYSSAASENTSPARLNRRTNVEPILMEDGDFCDETENMMDTEDPTTALSPASFRVSVEDTDDEENVNIEDNCSDDENHPGIIASRRRETMLLSLSDDEEPATRPEVMWPNSPTDFNSRPRSRLNPRVSTPSRIEPSLSSGDRNLAPWEQVLASGPEEVLAPHARFFIAKNKNRCSIIFDPPVSGRFILVKLWSPAFFANIDVQSILAYGFAGPRYFPDTEVR